MSRLRSWASQPSQPSQPTKLSRLRRPFRNRRNHRNRSTIRALNYLELSERKKVYWPVFWFLQDRFASLWKVIKQIMCSSVAIWLCSLKLLIHVLRALCDTTVSLTAHCTRGE
jgi:hypothetical protein